jgi:type I restriction enzyme M protein
LVSPTGEAETYQPIAEIVAELEALEVEVQETDVALKGILASIMG